MKDTMNTVVLTKESADKAERMIRMFSKNVFRKENSTTTEIHFSANEKTMKDILREVALA